MKRRRYIPLSVRVEVADRQWSERFGFSAHSERSEECSWSMHLAILLKQLFGDAPVELHHRPALVNRPLNRRKTDTVPPANAPAHLVYLLKDEEHRIETYVRGVGAQLSDTGQRRKNKRMAKNRNSRKGKIVRRLPAMRRWASRPFPKGRNMRSRR